MKLSLSIAFVYSSRFDVDTAGAVHPARESTIQPDKVTIAQFPEQEAKVEKGTLKDVASKQSVNVDRTAHPLPELKPDKALVVAPGRMLPAFHATARN